MVKNRKINMKKTILMTALVGLTTACGPKYVQPTEGSQTGFALSFFRNADATVSADENVIVSPYSAGVALSMLAEGAEGETRAEFDKALNGSLFKAVDLGCNDTVVVKSSNSLWLDDDFSVRNRYVSLLQKDFDAFVDVLNFADPATVRAINNWCAEHTEGKINDIIDRLSPDMVMVLANALYFNAPWENAFDEDATAEDVFHGRAGEVKVQMMARKGKMKYAEYEGCQMVELPYAGGGYAMYVVLPPQGMSADAVIPYIGETAFETAMGMLSEREVMLRIPKFRLEASFVLNRTLQKMGINTAFTSAADFKGISEMGPLVLDQVKQKCFIEVSEKGTEAAAVTVAQVRLTSVAPDRKPIAVMTVDRPYLFFIADKENSDNILFAGKIVNL